MRYEKRGRRGFIKMRLSDKRDALRAEMIIESWKQQRQAAQFLTDAILLYDALNAGDVSKLYEMFPTLLRQSPAYQTLPEKPHIAAPKISVDYQEPSEQEAIDDLLDMF